MFLIKDRFVYIFLPIPAANLRGLRSLTRSARKTEEIKFRNSTEIQYVELNAMKTLVSKCVAN